MNLELDEKLLYRIISGALKSCIDAHGPINKQIIPSASKRVRNQINGYIFDQLKRDANSKVDNDCVLIKKQKLNKLISNARTHTKTINHFLNKIEELNKEIEELKK